MDFTNYIRVPFPVEACQITEENLEEMAHILGQVKTKNGEKYIALNRNVVPNISKAYVGWWVTRFGDNLRCYNPKVFAEQFTPMHEDGKHDFQFNPIVENDDVYRGEPIKPAAVETVLTGNSVD